MANYTWDGVSGDWQDGADWQGGAPPGALDTAIITSSASCNISVNEAVQIGSVTMDDANAAIWDADDISLAHTFLLEAGTLGLSSGMLSGGTLALDGGVLLSEGGGLDNTTVQGALNIALSYEVLDLYGQNYFSGNGGTGSGTISLTAVGATLDLVGSQSISNVDVLIGSQAPVGFGGPAVIENSEVAGSQTASTLTIANGAQISLLSSQAELVTGGGSRDAVVNDGSMEASSSGGVLEVGGVGSFINNGSIAVSNGATFEISGCTFVNHGSLSVDGAALDFSGTLAGSALACLSAATLTQAQVLITGDVANAGYTVNVGGADALAQLSLSGTITGGTIVGSGPGLTFSGANATLDGVSYQGTLQVASGETLTVADSISLSTGGGTGVVNVEGAGAVLQLEGDIDLGAMTVNLGATSGTAEIGTADTWSQSSVTTATLGVGVTINQTAGLATINSGFFNEGQYLVGDTIINDGTILNTAAGATLTVSGIGVFINAGSMSIGPSGALVEQCGSFENTGTLTLASNATATITGTNALTGLPDDWSNSGIVDLNGGTLALFGNCTNVSLGSFEGSGTLEVQGTLTNFNNTLSIGGSGGVPLIALSGTIIGGNISCGSGNLVASSNGSATLSGVSLNGLLKLNSADQNMDIVNGTALSGTVEVEGAGALLKFLGAETLNNCIVDLGATGLGGASIDVGQAGSGGGAPTLTLGTSVTISIVNADASLGGSADEQGSVISSFATITDDSALNTLSLLGSDFVNDGRISVGNNATLAIGASSFSNSGSIQVNGANLSILSSLSLSALGSTSIENSHISIYGQLNEGGGTITIGTGSQWGTVSLSGTIQDGTVCDDGGGLQATNGATLNDVTYCGTLALTNPYETLTVEGGGAFTGIGGSGAGSIRLTGQGAQLVEEGDETIGNATVLIGSSTNYNGQAVPAAELYAAAGGTLTIASSSMVRSAGPVGVLGNATAGGWTDTVINDGTILSATTGGTIMLESTNFQNFGGIITGTNSTVAIGDASFENFGGMSIAAGGSVVLTLSEHYQMPNAPRATFSNSGTIRLYGAIISENTEDGLETAVPIVNASSGTIIGLGTIYAPIANSGTIVSAWGVNLDISGAITGVGTLEVNSGCVLELGSSVASGQTVIFEGTNATLRLDSPLGFSATVEGFQSGDSIDINNTPVESVAIGNGKLLLGTANGTLAVSSQTPIAGEISVGKDAHGGRLATYTAQAPGSGVGGESQVTISVAQPQMLFWASVLGDTFEGTSTNLNGASIANWTTADTLDVTDFLPSEVSVLYTQSASSGTLVVTEGTHSTDITLLGYHHASWFGVSADQHGGTLITYSH